MVYVLGIVSLVIFYAIVLGIGLWASRKRKTAPTDNTKGENAMLAGRNLGYFVGCFSFTATWVDGGFVNGTAESVYSDGLLWCIGPVGYAMSLFMGGLLFAKPMRANEYITMLDPLQEKYGIGMGGLLYLPTLCSEIFWTSAILSALGATISVIVNLDPKISIIVSGCIAIMYTLHGGLYSVTYTDVIEISFIFIALWLSVPFCLTNTAVKSLSLEDTDWLQKVEGLDYCRFIDGLLSLIFGGIPWQSYFQRVLACKTVTQSQILSFVGAFGVLFMAVPPCIIGIASKATDWNETAFGDNMDSNADMVLPLAIQYLTPSAVSFIGLGALSAAVMSSVDASILSASSMFSRNIYNVIFRQNASEKEVMWVLRGTILVVGALATAMALTVNSITGLWYLCSDMVYVILFPQLCCVIYFNKSTNTYGSLSGYIVAILLRASAGESQLSLPALIEYPFYKDGVQYFPFKTISMIAGFATIIAVSELTEWLFKGKLLPKRFDVFRCTSAWEVEKEVKVAAIFRQKVYSTRL